MRRRVVIGTVGGSAIGVAAGYFPAVFIGWWAAESAALSVLGPSSWRFGVVAFLVWSGFAVGFGAVGGGVAYFLRRRGSRIAATIERRSGGRRDLQ